MRTPLFSRLTAITALVAATALAVTGPASAQTATSDTSPVNLSVVRMEYSPTGSFLDDPSFDIMDRDFTVPAYTSSVSDGWLTITTSQLTFSYELGSGPFTTANTKMRLLGALPPGASANVTPTWGWECTFGQACQAGAATLSGGASIAGNHLNYLSPAGFVAGLTATGADASWQALGAPAGAADVTIRFSNATGGDGNLESRTEHLVVNGTATQIALPTTSSWDAWSTVTVPVTLTSGTNTIAVDCESGDSCNVNLDDIAVIATGATPAAFLQANPLGGYIRSYDSVNGSYSGVFSQPGVTPDAWINYLTAQQMVNDGERGFDLARIGASNQASQAGAYPAGPWADHRSAIAFTGDTEGTWNTLASEAQLAQDEGSIGQPYVSDDIGSFLGSNTTGNGNDSDDLYLRWLRLGTFQPIMREHSDQVDWGQNARLPWEYDAATQAVGDQFMQLREQLVPYLYTLAEQASSTGIPMTQALYLNYPSQAAAFTNPTEYTLGSDVLVAPVTTPGASVAQSVWFPPGTWQDYFTGATFTGPGTQTIDVPTSRMPVFVKEGGIIPLQPPGGQAQTAGTAPITLQVHAGANGGYSLYDDAGTGLGYQSGQSTQTPVSYTENASAAPRR